MKVLPPLEIEPATSNAEGIESAIGLLGCSYPFVTKAATLLRTWPQIHATKSKGSRSVSNPSDLGTNTGRFNASGVSKKIFSTPSSPKTLPLGLTSSSLFGSSSDHSSGVSPGGRMRATSFFFTPSTDNVNGSTSSDDGLSE